MKRYNCKHGPVDMEEDANGYWVTHDDLLLCQLENNKQLEKTWRAQSEERERLNIDNIEEIAKLRNTVVIFSCALFGALAALGFKLLS